VNANLKKLQIPCPDRNTSTAGAGKSKRKEVVLPHQTLISNFYISLSSKSTMRYAHPIIKKKERKEDL